jgi:putrescine transport system permease protein
VSKLSQTLARFLQNHFGRFWMVVVYLFLYTPLVFLILFSFNSTRQDGIFTGFSTRWYTALLNDSRLVSGFFLSLRVAVVTGTLSTILGTFAAFVLVRYQRFRGRSLFSGLVSAPLVMPEVIIGLSLLLLMVSVQHAVGWPDRGVTTIVIGHTLLGMAYATVVISARLRDMDRSDRRSGNGSRLPSRAGVLSGHACPTSCPR